VGSGGTALPVARVPATLLLLLCLASDKPYELSTLNAAQAASLNGKRVFLAKDGTIFFPRRVLLAKDGTVFSAFDEWRLCDAVTGP
jgi:hypothetical protein